MDIKHNEVNICFSFLDNDDLKIKIDDLVGLFNNDILNCLNVDNNKQIVEIKTRRLVTQNHIIALFQIFETNNIQIQYKSNLLWIIIDNVI